MRMRDTQRIDRNAAVRAGLLSLQEEEGAQRKKKMSAESPRATHCLNFLLIMYLQFKLLAIRYINVYANCWWAGIKNINEFVQDFTKWAAPLNEIHDHSCRDRWRPKKKLRFSRCIFGWRQIIKLTYRADQTLLHAFNKSSWNSKLKNFDAFNVMHSVESIRLVRAVGSMVGMNEWNAQGHKGIKPKRNIIILIAGYKKWFSNQQNALHTSQQQSR